MNLTTIDPSAAAGGIQLTMTSREIAELTAKEHKNVLRDIKALLAGLKTEPSAFEGSYTDSTGRILPCFNLPKRECLILVSGYSVELRARIIDRWMELEAQVATPADPIRVLNDPAAMRGLLLTYSEKVLALEDQVADMAPTVEAFDRLAKADGSLCVTDAAKALQVRPKDLFSYLREHGWIYKRVGSDHHLGYQTKVASGLLEHKVTTVLRADGSEKITEQCRITPKGLAALGKLMPPAATSVAA
jgi:phage antirepressor YoqD-like protein